MPPDLLEARAFGARAWRGGGGGGWGPPPPPPNKSNLATALLMDPGIIIAM